MATADDTVDVVVIGSGAGGAPTALTLAQAGARVVVLEKGSHVTLDDKAHDEIRICRRNLWVPYPEDEPHTLRHGTGPAQRTAEGWTANVVGGATVHFSGYFFRMHPVDMRMRSTLGAIHGANLVDWPIDYAELEPYYARVDATIGVSGRWRKHPHEEPRSRDFPFPPLAEDPIAARIDEASARLGMHSFPTPRAIISRPWNNRSACSHCALCAGYACEYDAKSSTNVSLLPAAVATTRCEIRTESMATEIEVGRDGRVTGVVYRDRSGTSKRIAARCVVLACTAIESARLLLLSASSKFPDGLGNANGLVGKNLVFSSTGIASARFFHPRTDPVRSRPFVQRAIQDYYLLDQPVDGVRKAGTLLFDWEHANPISTAERLAHDRDGLVFGKRLKDSLRRNAAGASTLRMEVFGEYLPTDGTFIDLDPSVRDRWGSPVARITESRHPLDVPATKLLVERGMSVLGSLGADDTRVDSISGVTRFLQGGTCRFGDDPATSVLDRTCKVHGVPNLYVTDGSFLPNGGSVPVTLTILANSFRVADHIAAQFRDGQL